MKQEALNQIAADLAAQGKPADEIRRELFAVKGARVAQIARAVTHATEEN